MTNDVKRSRGRALGRGPRAPEGSEAASAEGASTVPLRRNVIPKRRPKNHESMRATVERWRRDEASRQDEAYDQRRREDGAEADEYEFDDGMDGG